MPRKPRVGKPPFADPDDAPDLTEEFFARADIYHGRQLVRRGRPKVDTPKQQVTLRLDAAVLEGLRATGPGWQTRANEALKLFLARRSVGSRSRDTSTATRKASHR